MRGSLLEPAMTRAYSAQVISYFWTQKPEGTRTKTMPTVLVMRTPDAVPEDAAGETAATVRVDSGAGAAVGGVATGTAGAGVGITATSEARLRSELLGTDGAGEGVVATSFGAGAAGATAAGGGLTRATGSTGFSEG